MREPPFPGSRLHPTWIPNTLTEGRRWDVQNCFRETIEASERWIWAPTAHEYFSESCFFYLVRATARDAGGGSLATFVNSILMNEGLPGQTVHGLFGFHDFLVRIWSDETGRKRFLRALQQSPLEIEDISEFRVEQIRYTFAAKRSVTVDDVAPLEPLIRRVVTELSQAKDVSSRDLETLEDKGLVIQVPAASGIRVYILLESNASRLYRAAVDDELEALERALQKPHLQNPSIYYGVGRISYIIKVIATSFEALSTALQDLYHSAGELGFRSTTLPVPEEPTRYVEDSLRLEHAGPEVDRVVESLVLDDARSVVESLSSQDRQRLVESFRLLKTRVPEPTIQHRLLEVLSALVVGDEDTLATGLAFLTQLENRLSRVLFHTFAELAGPDWKRQVELAIRPELDPERHWTLKTLMDAYRYGAEAINGFASSMSPFIRADIVKSFRAIQDLRNSYTHGTIYSLLTGVGYPTDRQTLFMTSMDAGEFYWSLDNSIRSSRR